MLNKEEIIYNHLQDAIQYVYDHRTDFVQNSATDFSRTRKLPMDTVIETLLKFGSQSLQGELFDLWQYAVGTPTASALVQARSKIKIEAFQKIFEQFNQTSKNKKTYRGYQLLAHDGSDINLPLDENDEDTYFKNGQQKGYNLLHLNALYDVLNQQYINVDFQGGRKVNERDSLCRMANSMAFDCPVIFLGDRGYPSFNVLEHLKRSGQKFVIRCKDVASNGFLKKTDLPETDEFDTIVSLKLTYLQTKAIKADPSFRFLSTTSRFDFLERGSKDYYEVNYRVVRVKLSETTYECLITNLDTNFTPDHLKELYQLRWGIETSFRDLKYTLDLNALHSKKKSFIYQEIYSRLSWHA